MVYIMSSSRFAESYVNDKLERVYENHDGQLVPKRSKDKSFSILTLLSLFRCTFLPDGYPHSVSSDYIFYQGWDTVQAFASSISGSLATAAVLEGVGVGDDTASPLAASITWLLRDGTGMVGRILFAAQCGTRLDYDCKKWRLFADILNDIAMFIEIVTPRLSKDMTLAVLCGASFSRSIVGVAGGATKAAVAQHQAKNHNMADLSAKDGSQETMVNLLALLVNLWLLPRIAHHQELVMPLFGLMTLLHIFANYKAVRSLEFDTLNCGRMEALLSQFSNTGQIINVLEGNHRESLAFNPRKSTIRLGSSLTNLKGDEEINRLTEAISNKWKYLHIERRDTVFVYISTEAGARDVNKAYISAWLHRYGEKNTLTPERMALVLGEIQVAGWNLDRLAIQTEGFTFMSGNNLHQD